MEFSRSESAQQLSACAWVTLSEPLSCEFPLCIGQAPPSEQHAIRASGLDIHPAQTAAFPAIKARASARAERRFATVITRLGWSTAQPRVNRYGSAKSAKDERSENDLPRVVVAPGPGTRSRPGVEWPTLSEQHRPALCASRHRRSLPWPPRATNLRDGRETPRPAVRDRCPLPAPITAWTSETMFGKARAGLATGGRTFGYVIVAVNTHKERA